MGFFHKPLGQTFFKKSKTFLKLAEMWLSKIFINVEDMLVKKKKKSCLGKVCHKLKNSSFEGFFFFFLECVGGTKRSQWCGRNQGNGGWGMRRRGSGWSSGSERGYRLGEPLSNASIPYWLWLGEAAVGMSLVAISQLKGSRHPHWQAITFSVYVWSQAQCLTSLPGD